MTEILREDLESILSAPCIEWEKYNNATFYITGATGLVGSLLVKALVYANEVTNANIKIVILARNLEKVADIFGEHYEEKGIRVVLGDIRTPISIEENVDYLVHAASVTASKYMVTNPVETLMTSIEGTRNVLEFAKEKNVKGMIYISSMEVYGRVEESMNPISEDKLGYIDILNVRSSYSEGKRACECLCASYSQEYNVPVKIARLAQTFGAGVAKSEGRIFAQFAKSVLSKEDIVLHTKGESYGNYCYTADCVSAMLCLMTKGANGEAYTVVNEETNIQVKDMAQKVATELANDEIKVIFDIPESSLQYGYAPDTKMKLLGGKMCALGWNPKVGLMDMYTRMMKDWEYCDGK